MFSAVMSSRKRLAEMQRSLGEGVPHLRIQHRILRPGFKPKIAAPVPTPTVINSDEQHIHAAFERDRKDVGIILSPDILQITIDQSPIEPDLVIIRYSRRTSSSFVDVVKSVAPIHIRDSPGVSSALHPRH